MLTALLFLTPLLLDSWPAITLFAAAGVVIYARCERWCGDLAVQQARSALERRKLSPMSATVPLTGARLAHIDTVYITRWHEDDSESSLDNLLGAEEEEGDPDGEWQQAEAIIIIAPTTN